MKRQFMHMQPSQEKNPSGYAQSNPSSSQPENTPTPPKKSGSGLLSSANAKANNAQRSKQSFRPTSSGLLGRLPSSTQAPIREVEKQNSHPGSSISRGGPTPLASRAATPSSQIPAQQPPNSFASSNQPQRPAQQLYPGTGLQTRPAPNFHQQTTPRVSNNPSNGSFPGSPAPTRPSNYQNTGNPGVASPPRAPGYPGGPPPYSGIPPMQQMPATHPSYGSYSPPLPLQDKGQRRFPIWIRIAMGFVALILLTAGGLFTYYQVQIAPSLNNIIGHGAIHQPSGGSKSANQSQTDTRNSPLRNQNRINILLLGSDNDGKNDVPLAQTDIIVTIDQQKRYVGMLSIPRDLQVDIPNTGSGKMDIAFSLGWQAQGGKDDPAGPQAGAGLAEDTIEQNFGIHIDRYAWVGLDGYVKVIDTLGGVDVDVLHPMVDDTYPDDVANTGGSVFDYKRLYIAPGPQHLNGPQALEYVRTRHSDLIGDFGRSARQQQVLSALKTKLATPNTIAQIPQLLKALNGYVLTDMQLDDLAFLGNLGRSIDMNKVQRVTLSPPYSTPSSYNSNYLPNCPEIRTIIGQMFDIQPKCVPQEDGGVTAVASIVPPLSHSTTQARTVIPQGDTQVSQQPTSQGQQAHHSRLSSINVLGGIQALLSITLMTVFESFNTIQR